MPVAPPAQSEESCCTIGNATCGSLAVASVLPSSVELFVNKIFPLTFEFCILLGRKGEGDLID